MNFFLFILIGIGTIIVGIILGSLIVISRTGPSGITAALSPRPIPSPSQSVESNPKLKSVRLDLSSIDPPANMDQFKNSVIARLKDVGANTVFLSPWADGRANYQSGLMRESAWGNNHFVESFITAAHTAGLQVYAWFVTGKDDFDSELHPEWFSKTVEGKNYYHNDDPGVYIPMASLANADYSGFHKKVLKEISSLPFDGWVISEPLMSWGDKTETSYADFSLPMTNVFKQQTGIDPKQLFNPQSHYYYQNNPALYGQWVTLRANTVTAFTQQSISEIRTNSSKPIVITLYTEPRSNGQLRSFSEMREWLGEDIPALASLKPDYFEIEDLFYDFDNQQKPEWVSTMVTEFKDQLKAEGYSVPIMVSVQGYDGTRALTHQVFSKAIETATVDSRVHGVSFYAYHTLTPAEWSALKTVWNP